MSAPAEPYSPSRALEAAGRELTASLVKGMREAEANPLPADTTFEERAAVALQCLSPETVTWMEQTVKRSFWPLYDEEDEP